MIAVRKTYARLGLAMVLLCLFSLVASAQHTMVSGVIKDKSGEVLPGASVMIKRTRTGVMADIDGQYAIAAKQTDVLVYSYIGMTGMEITVGTQSRIDVSLEPDQNVLEESVAIGYGKQIRSLLTNSISRVSSKEFEHSSTQNALSQLQGKVPGLSLQVSTGQPGSSPQVFIRGGSSTSPEADTPLIIVDGIISQGMRSISDMNPADIGSIEILKDAASTAIYGARAANGIILVTTKKGEVGKVKVNYCQTVGVSRQPQKVDLLSARDYIYLSRMNTAKFNKKELVHNGNADPAKFLTGSWGMSTGNPRNSKNTLEFLDTYIIDYGADYVADLIENQSWQTMVDPVTGKLLIFQDNDMQDATYHDAIRLEEDLSVSGGSQFANYYVGLRHLKEDGVLRGTDYENYNILFNGSYKVSDKWTVFTKATFQSNLSHSASNTTNSISRAILIPPTYRLYYEDGTPAEGEGSSSFRTRMHEVYYKYANSYNNVLRTSFSVGANWNILDGLTFTPTVYYAGTEGIENTFEELNATTGTEIRPAKGSHGYDGHIQADAVLNYQKQIRKHNVNAVAGGSYNKETSYRLTGNGSGSNVDFIPTLNATADSTQRVTSTLAHEAIVSTFGRVNYAYDGKYMASVSLRVDGSSRFAENHRWGFFPGASAGWNIHKEKFFAGARDVVSNLKLRASWGRTGNNNLSLANSHGQYGITGDNYMGKVGILNSTLKNANLVWETTESYDIGLDMGFLNNRISLLADVFDKYTYNRLYDEELWNSTGFESIKSNYGTIRNYGVEFALDATPVSTRNFSWNLSATFAFSRSVVISLPDNGQDKNRVGGRIVYDPVLGEEVKVGGIAEGERFGQRWAFQYEGPYQTEAEAQNAPTDPNAQNRIKHAGDAKFTDLNEDGILDAKDMVFMGYIRPDKQGALTNEFHWKGLSARIVMDWAVGHVIDNGFKAQFMASSRNNNNATYEVFYNTWKYEGHTAYYPKYTVQSDFDYQYRNTYRWDNQIGSSTSGATNNSAYYSKGDYLAFREVSLSYMIPEKFCKKIKVSGLELFAGAYNLGYISAYSGFYPEIFTGLDFGIYPRPRQYNMGVNITF